MELDFAARIANIGLLVEVTAQQGNQRQEILKFVRHCNLFVDSPRPLREKIRLLRGIPRNARGDFERIVTWKYLYIGTSQEIITEGLDGRIAPGDPLYVFNQEHHGYLKFLVERIGRFASFELFKALGISPDDIGDNENDISVPAILLANRRISERVHPVDLYVFTAPVLSLLKTARVMRYGSLDSWIPEVGENYQRLLNEQKLAKMQTFLRHRRERSTFPNAVTVVLGQTVNPLRLRDGRITLRIPIQYGSLQMIDGQHRLFAYAKSGLTADQLQAARLIAVGIKFGDADRRTLQEWSARTFVEINKEQTKVPTELINLISYSAMGDVGPKSLAARIVVELNIVGNGPLANVFRTRPFQTKNRVKGRPVRIVSVTNELARLFDPDNANAANTLGIYETFSHDAWIQLENRRADTIVAEGKRVVSTYFGAVSDVFYEDWNSKDSLIFTANYLSAFSRLLVEFRRGRDAEQMMRTKVERIKAKMIARGANRGPGNEIFFRQSNIAPQVGGRNKVEIPAIYEFLRERTQP